MDSTKLGGVSEVVLQNIDCSVSEFHVLLGILDNVSLCRLIISGSCSFTKDGDEADIPMIHLTNLIVKASMSTHTLSALLKPLVISEVRLQDCTVLDEDKENNVSPKESKVSIIEL